MTTAWSSGLRHRSRRQGPGARLAQAARGRGGAKQGRGARPGHRVLCRDRLACRAGRRQLLHRAARRARGPADQHDRGGGRGGRSDWLPGGLTMIDTCAAGRGEAAPIPELIERFLSTGKIAHIHLNDPIAAPPSGRSALRRDSRGLAAPRLRRHLLGRAVRLRAGRPDLRRPRDRLPAGTSRSIAA